MENLAVTIPYDRGFTGQFRSFSFFTLPNSCQRMNVIDQASRRVAWAMLSPFRESLTLLTFNLEISTLPDDRIDLVRPIVVEVRQDENEDWVVSFDEANVSMSGEGPVDAYQAFSEYLVELFLLLTEKERVLGPGPQEQLAVLREYMRVQK
jgi:hypothetical protein